MKYRYHIYTPVWRLKNIPKLIDLLAPLGLIWHPIYDSGVKYVHPNLEWIKPSTAPPPPRGWHPSSWKDNWFIEHNEIDDLGRYQHLSDDDWYAGDFFQKLDEVEDDVIIVSMMNGPTPEGPRSNLLARPGCIQGGRIGAQQIVVAGYIFRHYRYGPGYAGDWNFISSITSNHPYVFVEGARVFWNHI